MLFLDKGQTNIVGNHCLPISGLNYQRCFLVLPRTSHMSQANFVLETFSTHISALDIDQVLCPQNTVLPSDRKLSP